MKKSMKISKKLIVSALSTGMGVSLVGAITGTVAWYQYSTRSTVSFVGTSVGTSENLLVSLDNSHFDNDLTDSEVATALGDTTLAPVTTGNIARDGALPEHFKAQPIYQRFGYEQWVDADANAYIQFDLYLKLNMLDENGDEVPVNEQRNVYLSDLLIRQNKADTQSDISDAVRVQLATNEANVLLSKKGETIDTHGELDLNGDGIADKTKPIYSFYTQEEIDAIPTGTYGAGTQSAYVIEDVAPTPNAQGVLSGGEVLGTLYSRAVVPALGEDVSDGTYFTDPDLAPAHVATGTADGSTTYYVSQNVLTVTVTIWLEGWQQLLVEGQSKSVTPALNTNLDEGDYFLDVALTQHATGTADGVASYYTYQYDSIWDANDYIGSIFDVGLLFEVNA